MKVKVIKASLSSYWYAEEIGKIYDAEEVKLENHKFKYKVVDSEFGGTKHFYEDDVEIINEENDMKKSDLKSGMQVETRNGIRYLVLLDSIEGDFVLVGEGHWSSASYDEDMLSNRYNDHDIMTVYRPPIFQALNLDTKHEIIWERKEQTEQEIQLGIVMQQIQQLQKEAEKLQQVVAGASK